jgi:hypothetical protein
MKKKKGSRRDAGSRKGVPGASVPPKCETTLAFDDKEHNMDTYNAPSTVRGLSVSSLILGVLGGVFYWWLPLGMVLSLSGLLLGFFDWTMARRRSLDYRLSIVAILLSAAALALDIVIAVLGLQTVTFGGP